MRWFDDLQIIKMRFYRNLGSITFEADIGNFQIFNGQSNSCIFQDKTENTSHLMFEEVANFYRQYLHGEFVKSYSEEGKGSCLLITSCKKTDVNNLDVNELCDVIHEICKIVQRLSMVLYEWVGDITVHQVRQINGKVSFIYIPTVKVKEKTEQEQHNLLGILNLVNMLKKQENVTHRLLAKKLGKCKSLSEITQEIKYFLNIYGAKQTKDNIPVKINMKMAGPRLNLSIKDKSRRKLNLFKMDKLDHSYGRLSNDFQNTFYSHKACSHYSQTRKSSSAIHIAIPSKNCPIKRQNSNSYTSSRQLRPSSSSNKKTELTMTNSMNMSISQFKNTTNSKIIKQKSLKKSKLQEAAYTPVSLADEQKLLKKLHSKKTMRTQTQKSQKQLAIPVKFSQTHLMHQKKFSQKQIINSMKQIYRQVTSQKQYEKSYIQNKNNEIEKQPIKHSIEGDSLLFSKKSEREIPKEVTIKKQNVPKQVKNSSKNYTQIIKNQSLLNSNVKEQKQIKDNMKHQIQLQRKQQKKLKKKPIIKQEDLCNSQIQIIQFTKKPKENQEKKKTINSQFEQTKKEKSNHLKDSFINQCKETRKNSWNQVCSNMQETQRLSNKTETNQQKIYLQKCRMLDYMGLAVVNTNNYLKNYQKIFWELPMFFLYRQFYLKRQQLALQVAKNCKDSLQFKDLDEENDKIKIAVNKLIKVITKKLKKEEPNIMQTLKPFLNIDASVNCDVPMISMIKEYIESLGQASSQYPQLMMHQLQIIDAFLIARGHKLDESARQKAIKCGQFQFYICAQKKLLQTYK